MRLAIAGTDRSPSIPELVDHPSQVPASQEHRLAAVAQVDLGDTVTGQLGRCTSLMPFIP